MLTASLELYKHQIPFERVEAIADPNGAYGLFKTLLGVFERAEKEDWGNILIFEDDVCLIQENCMEYLAGQLEELKTIDWDLFYLGGNINAPFTPVPDKRYLLGCSQILSTHAVAYSKQGWKLVLAEMRTMQNRWATPNEPYDMLLMRIIQPRGKTYISLPLLATQRAGYSDVEKREVNYKPFLEDRYNERFKQLVW